MQPSAAIRESARRRRKLDQTYTEKFSSAWPRRNTRGARVLLIAYILVNAALYSVLLPLWEGFDEPFHFAYVQQLANGQGLPDARTARLSREVGASLLLAPASQAVQQNLPQATSYNEYFAWPIAKRLETRQHLWAIPAEFRWQPSDFLNYEAQHPPLAYLVLAIPERLLVRVPIPLRVAILRIIAAVAGSLLLLAGAERLLIQLQVTDPYKAIALFCLFSSQMLWATIAHVGNDWLALPVVVWTLVALNLLDASPNARSAAIAAAALAGGLLTKAYFLAFVPLLLGLCLCRRRWREAAIALLVLCTLAGPWYARNLVQYGVLTGTQEARSGIGLLAVLRDAPTVNWPFVIWSSVRNAVWTGNNTFMTFSANTLTLLVGTTLVAMLLWVASRHTKSEKIVLCYCSLFALALGYATVVSHIVTRGVGHGPMSWHSQVLLTPLLALAALGASRWPRLGRFVGVLLVLEFGYVLAATYIVKLIPLYGGYHVHTSLARMATIYVPSAGLAADLETVTLAPAAVIFTLTGAVILLVGAQQFVLIRSAISQKSFPQELRDDAEGGQGQTGPTPKRARL
jgi:hypothetical protein